MISIIVSKYHEDARMTPLTIAWNLLHLTLAGLVLWLGVACLVAARRLAFRPLLYLGILLSIQAIPLMLALLAQTWAPAYSYLVFIPQIVVLVTSLNTKIQNYLERNSLTFRDLLLFRYG
jgi:hypothetical protein